MLLTPGTRLKSGACETEVIVVKAPSEDVTVTCGGAPMAAPGQEIPAEISPDASLGTQMGKRYVNEAETLEMLCTKAGEGSLGLDETPLMIKEAKPLPASD